MLLRFTLVLLPLSFLVGCGGDEGTCLYQGKSYQNGEEFPAGDGCNTCKCNPKGTTDVGCTTKGCPAPVVTPGNDSCLFQGKTYRNGEVFPKGDGCNTCSCNPEGTKGVGCSQKLCDGLKADFADCAADQECRSKFCFQPRNQSGQVRYCATIVEAADQCPTGTSAVWEPGVPELKLVCLMTCNGKEPDQCKTTNPQLRCTGITCDAEGWYLP